MGCALLPGMMLRFAALAVFLGPLTSSSAGLLEDFKRDPLVLIAKVDLNGGEVECSDAARCSRMLPPCSTFKIPNTLIGLETGVVSGPEWLLRYDAMRDPAQKHWPADWAQDQDLRSAMKRSAVWYFQEIARRVGEEKYGEFLTRFDYGNRDISGGVDKFWLSSSLRINAANQLAFLRRFWRGELTGISARNIEITKEVLVLEKGDDWTWRGKTGSGPIPGTDRWVGWHVGGVETMKGTKLYALWVEGGSYQEIAQRRAEVLKRLLTELRE